ncbi:MAG: flagellar biosynthesis protein FlhF [Tepidisphaerales bacterium]
MKLHTFTAATMPEAVAQVKRSLGPHAVIVHTRAYQQRSWWGLRRREVVEVLAAPPERRPQREGGSQGDNGREGAARQNEAAPAGAGKAGVSRLAAAGASAYALHSNLKSAASARHDSAASMQPAGATAAASLPGEAVSLLFKTMNDQLSEVKSELRQLIDRVRMPSSSLSPMDGGELGETLYRQYERLLQHGVAAGLAEDIVKSLRLSIPRAYLGNESFVRVKMAEHLEKLIPSAGPVRRTKTSGPHVVALIGPTGVGKTTTIAKLAAELQLGERRRVGLITIDTYRIAAVDQLRKYAEIIGSPLEVVNTPEEMPAAITAMQQMDYVLIDTAGRSPTDTLKLSELRRFIEAARPDEVHLVLSTASDGRSVDLAVSAFSDVRVDKVLFTKIDEAAAVGVVLNVARKLNKPISYITTGQDVPHDIEVFRGTRLAELILGRAETPGSDLPTPTSPRQLSAEQTVPTPTVAAQAPAGQPAPARPVPARPVPAAASSGTATAASGLAEGRPAGTAGVSTAGGVSRPGSVPRLAAAGGLQ